MSGWTLAAELLVSHVPEVGRFRCGTIRRVSARLHLRRRSRTRPPGVVVVGLVLVLAQVALRGWAVWGSWFQFDDFVFISRLLGQPWSWSLVGQGYGGHLMPGGFTLTWWFAREDPLGFHPYAATLIVLQALASLGLLVLLLSLFGRRAGVLVPLSLALFTSLTFPAFVWWAAGINQLFLQIALTWGLAAHLRYLRTRHLRWVLVTALVIAGCLLFYEKVLLVFLAIAWLTAAYFVQGSPGRRLVEVWRRYWPAVLVYVVMGGGYIAWYAVAARSSASKGAGSTDLLPLAGNMVGNAWLPGVLGGPLRWRVLTGPFQLVDPGELVVAVSILLVALVLGAIATTYSRSWRAWILPAMFIAIDIALLQSARAGAVGPVAGLELRYVTELGLVTPLALGAACMPVLGAPEQVERRRAHRFLDDRELVAVATVLVCALGVFSTVRYADHWRGTTQSRTFFANADHTLGTESSPTPLANVSVPQYLMWGFDFPRNTTQYVLGMYADRMTFPDVSLDHLFVIGDDGRVAPADVTPLICLSRVGPTGSTSVTLSEPIHGSGAWARMSYVAKKPTTLEVTTGDTTRTLQLQPGFRNVYLQMNGDFDQVGLSRSGGSGSLCVHDLVVGFVVPVETAAAPS
jgi:hypothetical protein